MALAAMTCTSQAALSLTGGNFEDGGSGDTLDVANFFESATTGYDDYVLDTAVHGTADRKLALDRNGGYVYQSLGLYVDELALTLSGDVLQRNSQGEGSVTISFWQTGAGVVGADGSTVDTLTGATQLGLSFDLNAASYGSFAGSDDTIAFLSAAIDISGATVGNQIWFNIQDQNGGTGVETILNNLAVTTTAVPEPSYAALLGLGGLALIICRRK